jgi:hypothetical protein
MARDVSTLGRRNAVKKVVRKAAKPKKKVPIGVPLVPPPAKTQPSISVTVPMKARFEAITALAKSNLLLAEALKAAPSLSIVGCSIWGGNPAINIATDTVSEVIRWTPGED